MSTYELKNPCGATVSIRDFHSLDPGSIPGMGVCTFFFVVYMTQKITLADDVKK